MTDLHDAALRAGLWAVIEQRAKELKDAAKAELAALQVGDTVAGGVDGHLVAKATKVHGHRKLRVINECGYVEWVYRRWPDETWQPRKIGDAFRRKLEDRAVELGALIDDDGEVCPHVEVVEGEPYVMVRRGKDADTVVAQLFSSGRMSLDGVRALEPEPADRWTQDREAGAL